MFRSVLNVKQTQVKILEGAKILDASWYMPASNRDAKTEHLQRRIPGSRFFDLDVVCDQRSTLPHMLPSPEFFKECVDEMGISSNDEIIIYDTEGVFSSPRAWWTFKVFGHEKVSILNGGLNSWLMERLPIESGTEQPVQNTSSFHPNFIESLVLDKHNIKMNIEKKDYQRASSSH